MPWDEKCLDELERRVVATMEGRRVLDVPFYRFLYDPAAEIRCLVEIQGLVHRFRANGRSAEVIPLSYLLRESLLDLAGSRDRLIELETQEARRFQEDLQRELKAAICHRLIHRLQEKPLAHCAFITRVGALFPFVRVSDLLYGLEGRVRCIVVIPYPGNEEGEMLGVRRADTLTGYYRGDLVCRR